MQVFCNRIRKLTDFVAAHAFFPTGIYIKFPNALDPVLPLSQARHSLPTPHPFLSGDICPVSSILSAAKIPVSFAVFAPIHKPSTDTASQGGAPLHGFGTPQASREATRSTVESHEVNPALSVSAAFTSWRSVRGNLIVWWPILSICGNITYV